MECLSGIAKGEPGQSLTPVKERRKEKGYDGKTINIPSPVLESEQQHNQTKIADTHSPFCNARWLSCSRSSSSQSNGAVVGGWGRFEGEAPDHGSVLVLLLFLLRISVVLSLTMLFITSESWLQLQVS
ncbi:hypothetical protein DL770_008343 [Monosporascus sp. CRB-9-2]|nr:hypothetical protein DL770_008343 [Monosporascus sp. CRB-9-2]